MDYTEFDEMLALVAQAYDSTPAEICGKISQAICEGQKSSDPQARLLWDSIPHTGSELTLPDFVAYLAQTLQKPFLP